MYIQSKFSQNTIERIFADFQINSGEEVLYAIWLFGGRKGFVFTDRRFYWNIKTSIVRNSEVTDVKLPSNIMEKNVNGLSVKIISKEKEKTSPTSKYLYFALISHIGLIRYDTARLSYDEALKLKKIFTQYINESTLPEPRHKSFMDKLWANKEDAVDFLWCLKSGSFFKRQHKYITTRQDIEARNEKITDYDESDNASEGYESFEDEGRPEVQSSEEVQASREEEAYVEPRENEAPRQYDEQGYAEADSREGEAESPSYSDERPSPAQNEVYDESEEVPPGPGREYVREQSYSRPYDDQEEDDQDDDSEDEEAEEASDSQERKSSRRNRIVSRRLKALLIRQKRAKAQRQAERYAASMQKASDEDEYDDDSRAENEDVRQEAQEQAVSEHGFLENIHYHILDVLVTLVYATASLFALKSILFAKSVAKPLNAMGRVFAEIGKLFFVGVKDPVAVAGLSEIESRSDYVTVLIDKSHCVFAIFLIFYLIGRTLLILKNKSANKKLSFIFMIGFVLICFLLPVLKEHKIFIVFVLLAFALYGAMQAANGASKLTVWCKVFAFLLAFGMEYYLIHLLLYPGFADVMSNVVQILGS